MAIVLPLFTFIGCSDDDDESIKNELIGTWVESKESNLEVYHIQFDSNSTGYQWVTNKGIINEYGKEPFTWKTSGSKLTVIMDGESITANYNIKNNILTVDFGAKTITCKRE